MGTRSTARLVKRADDVDAATTGHILLFKYLTCYILQYMAVYPRAYSHYTLEALQLLGEQIRLGRRERRWTQAELAERAGVSVRTLNRVEHGDPRVALGTAFELATLVGVPLFHADRERLSMDLERTRARSAVLPQRVRRGGAVDDEF